MIKLQKIIVDSFKWVILTTLQAMLMLEEVKRLSVSVPGEKESFLYWFWNSDLGQRFSRSVCFTEDGQQPK